MQYTDSNMFWTSGLAQQFFDKEYILISRIYLLDRTVDEGIEWLRSSGKERRWDGVRLRVLHDQENNFSGVRYVIKSTGK